MNLDDLLALPETDCYDIDPQPTEHLIALHQEATNLGRRLTKIRKGLITQLADQLGYDNHTDLDGGTWSLGHRRKRSCVNPQALAEWLGDDWPKAYNLGTAKITALRTLARQRGLDPGAVETSFFDDEWQIAGLRYTPPKELRCVP